MSGIDANGVIVQFWHALSASAAHCLGFEIPTSILQGWVAAHTILRAA